MKLLLILSFILLISYSYSEISPLTGAKETISFYNDLVASDLVKDFTGKIGKHLQMIFPFAGPLGNLAYFVLSLIEVHQADNQDIFSNLTQKLNKSEHKLDVMSDQVSADLFLKNSS